MNVCGITFGAFVGHAALNLVVYQTTKTVSFIMVRSSVVMILCNYFGLRCLRSTFASEYETLGPPAQAPLPPSDA